MNQSTDMKFEPSEIDKLFESVDCADSPGAVCGIALNGETIYRKAFGMSSVQHGVANTVNTKMRIGSTTKHFTSFAALMLAEQGKLDLDAPVTEYIPELPKNGLIPSLRQFMNHTSGYRCSVDLSMTMNGSAMQPLGWTLDILSRQISRNFEPNQAQIYNNGCYYLLSIAIDRASGISLEQFLQENVFIPLGMKNTSALLDDNSYEPNMASFHLPKSDGRYKKGVLFWQDIRGEANMISTIDDMLLWMANMNRERKVGSEKVWAQMFETPTLANGLKSVYSLGLQNHQYRGINVVHHSGSVEGGNSQMISAPDYGLDIIIMANGVNVKCQEIAKAIIDIVLSESLVVEKPTAAPFEPFKHLADTRYFSKKSGTLISFGNLEGKLGLSFLGSPMLPILKMKGDSLHSGFEDIALGPFEFSNIKPIIEGEPPSTITFSESGNHETLELLTEPLIDLSDIGDSLVGDYYSHDGNAEAKISKEDGQILMTIRGDHSGANPFRVIPYSEVAMSAEAASASGSGFTISVTDSNRCVNKFELNTIRVRHLEFVRK